MSERSGRGQVKGGQPSGRALARAKMGEAPVQRARTGLPGWCVRRGSPPPDLAAGVGWAPMGHEPQASPGWGED